ncbi:type IV pilus twitching motility protein PilT [Thiolapillus sp.]|uniref:type IV pilus twitching motility protein PilT n=3 Tax=Thiolapillus sp. TaxID=2017437 RepID=UPI0025F86834|nr:ATPase, T2SS/T4P/T4SS family [Thiolapillus sp.]
MGTASDLTYPDEPLSAWDLDAVNPLLVWAVEQGFSDITLRPKSPVRGRLHGRWYAITRRPLMPDEVSNVANQLTRDASASAKAHSGSPTDFAYEVQAGRGRFVRFRGNLSGCVSGWDSGSEVILRMIPGRPPTPAELGIDSEMLQKLEPDTGLVLFSGTTGSGKSTSIAAVLKNILRYRRVNMQTIEDPVEFSLREDADDVGFCTQHEVPAHYQNFGVALRNMVRKAPDVVLVGEMRDRETMQNGLHLANAGAVVYSTLHADSVPQTLAQIVNRFDYSERAGVWAQLTPATRTVVYQKLEPCEQGGRLCIREWLEVTPDVRRELQGAEVKNIVRVTQEMLEASGRPLIADAKEKLEGGLISEETYTRITQERMHQDRRGRAA